MPYKVPDGYFDQLADRVMAQLPRQQAAPHAVGATSTFAVRLRTPLWRRWQGWAAAAAFAGVLVAGAMAVFGGQGTSRKQDAAMVARHQAPATTASYDSSVDMAASYTMIDNDEIYAMVSDNQYN